MKTWHHDRLTLPPYCEPRNEFLRYLSSAFDVCIPTNLAFISTLLGSLSILAWLFAQLPQIYKNYKLKSTAGLSIYFLIEWCLGDSTNLAGAVLTEQATWQVIVASYYTLVDLTLVFQFYYFTHYRKKLARRVPRMETPPRPGTSTEASASVIPSSARPINKSRGLLHEFQFPGSISPLGLEKGAAGSSRPKIRHPTGSSPLASPKTVLMLSMVFLIISRAQASPLPAASTNDSSSRTLREIIGQLVSWSSTALYLGSRLPQLHKNWKRKSTSGLSISLFISAFFGNLFYSLSLLTNPLAWKSYPPHGLHGWVGSEGSDRTTWVRLASPFFLGAAGVLGLDAAMAAQFWMYGEGKRGAKMIPVPDEDGQKHWERVSGWMRGFIPSPRLSPLRIPPAYGHDGENSDTRSLLGTTPPAERQNYDSIRNR